MTSTSRHFEDYEIGEERTSFARTITETDIVVHAGHSGDFYPTHMDAESMRDSTFGQRVAHGTMTFAIGIGLTAGDVNMLAFSYGYDRLRFPAPVFIGDTIHTRTRITAMEPDPKRPKYGRVTEEVRVLNQRGETVLACDHLYLVERRG